MGRYKVTFERWMSRVVVVEALNVDEAMDRAEAGELEEEWEEFGLGDEEIVRVESLDE